MASACLETMTLCSQPDFALKSAGLGDVVLASSISLWIFHQFSAAFARLSTLALPALYFCRIVVHLRSCSLPTGSGAAPP